MTRAHSDIVETAKELIEHHGWCQGAHARDKNGMVCRITSADAAVFSIYGAVVRALYSADLEHSDRALQNTMPLWEVLTRRARDERTQYTGVHPVMDFNDAHGRTQAEVVLFLSDCAQDLKRLETLQKETK